MEDEELDEQPLRIAATEVVGALMKHHPDLFVSSNMLNQAVTCVEQLFKQPDEDEQRLALFLACDILEHMKQRAISLWPKFMPNMLQGVLHKSAEIQQPSCYGISVAAKEPQFAEVAVDAAG